MKWDLVGQVRHGISTALLVCVLLNFLVTVKAAPHEYVIRSGLIQGKKLKMRCGICLLFNINIDADSVDLDQTAPIGTG